VPTAGLGITKASAQSPLIPEDDVIPSILITLVVVFGALVLFFEYKLLSKTDGKDTLRVLGITLIVLLAFLSVPAGFGPQQIAPVVGLFGTVAGYLLAGASKGGGE
jgi:hypothetical protein